MNSGNGFFYKLLMFSLAIVLAVSGWLITQSGFQSVQNIRQIERLPVSSIGAALAGEVKLNAQVKPAEQLLTSEKFQQQSVYYRCRYEEEETDSDGDTYWDTKFIHTKAVNFYLEDATGKILVNVESMADDSLDFSLPISDQQTHGATRHTEWRIEPDDSVFVLGSLLEIAGTAQISFIEPGQYLPIISKFSEAEEKSDIGISVILMISGGISLIALSAFCLTSGLAIHRIIAFLIILSGFVFVPLTHLGVSMLNDDIVSGLARLIAQSSSALKKINQQLKPYAHPINDFAQLEKTTAMLDDDLPVSLRQIIDEMQVNQAYAEAAYHKQLENFPNNLIAWFYSVPEPQLVNSLSFSQQQALANRLAAYQQATTTGLLPVAVITAGLLFCLGLSWLGFRLIRLKRHIENIPTSKSSGLVFGLAEIKGRIEKVLDKPPLKSPLTHSQCYWYHYIVEEKQQSGKDTKWVTIENRKDYAPFFCKDAYGEVKVMPANAEVISHHKKVETRGRYRYTEKLLKLADKVYVLGHAKIDRDSGDTLVIRGAKKERPFLITNLTEKAVMMRKANGGMISLTIAFSALMFASLFYLGVNGSFSPADYLLAAFLAPVYMSLMVLVLHYNDLVFLKQRAARNLSNINVSLQKRADLIPNLEKVVKKYLVHEKDLLQLVTRLRTRFSTQIEDLDATASQLENEQKILGKIIAKAEDYPELKAAKLNVKLMNKLIDLENEIALMREGYNDAVNYYNTRIATIPDVFFARAFGFQPMTLFHYEARRFSRVEVNWNK